MGLFDHLLTLLIMVAVPWSAMVQLPVILRQIEQGNITSRGRIYLTVATQQTVFGIVLLVYWFLSGREYGALGLRLELEENFPAALASAITLATLLVGGNAVLLGRVGGREWLRRRSGHIIAFLPHTVEERNRFIVLSASAGTWEEIFFRGFLLWYLGFYLGMWPAVALSSLVFALAHLYQGWVNAGLIAILGVVFASLYVWTGSLWLAMFLHVVIDVNAAFVGFRLNRDSMQDSALP